VATTATPPMAIRIVDTPLWRSGLSVTTPGRSSANRSSCRSARRWTRSLRPLPVATPQHGPRPVNRGRMLGNSRASAVASFSQYSVIAARSCSDYQPPERTSRRISSFSPTPMPLRPKCASAPRRQLPAIGGLPFVIHRKQVDDAFGDRSAKSDMARIFQRLRSKRRTRSARRLP
jgi:hypothetical protein